MSAYVCLRCRKTIHREFYRPWELWVKTYCSATRRYTRMWRKP